MRLCHSLSCGSGALALIIAACGGSPKPADSPVNVRTVVPEIVRVLPHDTAAFTQGLLFDNGRLYESTGLEGRSSLRILDSANGAVLKMIPIAGVFAEGLALRDNMVVQLTWQHQVAFVYRLPDLARVGTLAYRGEGWGLTADSRGFVMSNGSDTLYFRAAAFDITRTLPVRLRGRPLSRLNELEFARGSIFANVWYNDDIFEIDPRTGTVTTVIDCSDLVNRNASGDEGAVLNGIAYNPATDLFYLTGKDWRSIFEVRIPRAF